jgi:para-nitrobenzyl esterase
MIRMLGLLSLAFATPAAAQMVRVESGPLQGTAADGVTAFKGIPYAAAPVGPLRWHVPEPAAQWREVRDAGRFGADCMQNGFPGATGSGQPQSEDCLFLNVWSPARAVGAKLPVMVWIHGGGFVGGSSALPESDGVQLAKRGVIVVSFNYRLGRFGFFAHPGLTAEAGGKPSGNWGLMDQIAALQWVRRNIAGFGGDPAHVTIFGESAGGESVLRLMASPTARGLFARAIASSGGGRDTWPGIAAAEAKGAAFAAKAGAGDLAALRALPAATVLGGINLLNKEEAVYSGPITDGAIVPANADRQFAQGAEAQIPAIIGNNDDELGFVPAGFLPMVNAPALATLGAHADRVSAAYGTPENATRHIAADVMFTEPALAFARWHGRSAPTWLYRFGYVPAARRKPGTGAAHATDVIFQFDNLAHADFAATAEDRAVAGRIADLWVNFAKMGNPNGAAPQRWTRLDPETPAMLAIGTDAAMAPAASPALTAISAARDGK